jgi:hypothetical protein
MSESHISTGVIRSALFVDFDNIFSSFKELDNAVANAFARKPKDWLTWLEEDRDARGDLPPLKRKMLIRKCYLNPKKYSDYRPFFVSSAFEVIDCPPLTGQGKTSTDMHLLMDVLDALNHPVHFDEFIIFSGDADFTPLLLKLRMNDRFTTILCAGYASLAYKAACDYIISVDDFIRNALGIEYPEEEEETQIPPDEVNGVTKALLKKMADRIYAEATEPTGIQANNLPAIYKQFAEFAQSKHWLGFRSIRKLTEAVVDQRQDLVFIEEDPWCVARRESIDHESIKLDPSVDISEASPDTRQRLEAFVKKIVSESSSPVKLEYLANIIQSQFDRNLSDTKWFGAGTFKKLLKNLDLGELRLSSISPGFVYNPVRHHNQPLIMDHFAAKYPAIAPLAKKIHELTDIPLLLPEHYQLLFNEIARAVNESGFHLTRTSKIVRDRCVEKGAPISRANVYFILLNLRNAGYAIQSKKETAESLSEAFTRRTLDLCLSVQFALKLSEGKLVKKWLSGSG